MKIEKELQEMNQAIIQLRTEQAKQSLPCLREIALSPDHISVVEYTDLLIESEKQ